jgi:hypothetical protein
MIVERLTFQAKYGQGDALVELLREEARTFGPRIGLTTARVYTDATGSMFTVAIEQEFADLDAYARFAKQAADAWSSPEFGAWFARMEPLVERGDRQLLNVETLKAG